MPTYLKAKSVKILFRTGGHGLHNVACPTKVSHIPEKGSAAEAADGAVVEVLARHVAAHRALARRRRRRRRGGGLATAISAAEAPLLRALQWGSVSAMFAHNLTVF